jgi:hypothetical protein
MKEFNSREDYLLDMLEYYTVDPNNRRCTGIVERKGKAMVTCRYAPETLGLIGKSEGCAIGRNIPHENALKLDTKYSGETIEEVLVAVLHGDQATQEELDEASLIPEWMQNLGISFLEDVQDLHDRGSHWDLSRNRLSEQGEKWVKSLIEKYVMTPSKFVKFLKYVKV